MNLSDKDLELLRFVQLLTQSSYRNSPETIQKLREFGWTDAQIRETVLVVGMFSMFNRVADAFGLDDPDYFGRQERGEVIRPATRAE